MINMGLFRINNQDILAFRPQIDHNFTQVLNSDPVYESFLFQIKDQGSPNRNCPQIMIHSSQVQMLQLTDFNSWPPIILDGP